MRKTILGGIAVSATLGAMLASGATAAGPAGKPTAFSETLCGTSTSLGATASPNGKSNEERFGPLTFASNEQPAGTQCDNSNSSSSDGTTWTIGHGNVDPTTERGTEHGQYSLASQTRQGGFNGHVTDWNFSGTDSCTDSEGRTVYYQSGNAHYCEPDFGPVGNFNTHGGAATGDHSRGKYGTIIFQKGNQIDGGCYVGSPTYCIQVDLAGQIN